MTLLLALLILQGPGEGWILQQGPAREVKRLYWELFETTEVWVLILPENPQGEPPRVNLVFQAFFPGRSKRDPYSELPEWPKGAPDRLTVRVQPFPLTLTRELSLKFVIDDETFDLGASCAGPGGPGPPCQLLFPCPDCFANGMVVEVQPDFLRRLTGARAVTGAALGFPIGLSSDDLGALGKFAQAIHLGAGQ